MTRINLVTPSELMDQHLLAEWREIKMVPASLRRSLKTRSINSILLSVPAKFTLNAGHVMFFVNKLLYLSNRYDDLCTELKRRGVSLYHTGKFSDFCYDIPSEFFNDYTPTEEAFVRIRSRISEKIAMKPAWYKYYGKSILNK